MRPREAMRKGDDAVQAQQCKPVPFPLLNTQGFEATKRGLLHSNTPSQDKGYHGR